jgi:hypothetical protein
MSKGTANSLNIIIVERTGTLKSLAIKDFKEEELFKKCGFKKADGFNKQTEWNVKMDGNKYTIRAYAKDDGRANSENKYDFPPPIDTKLFFGSCALVALTPNDKGEKSFCDLSLILWNKIYEKLFGGFEDLATTAAEDEAEEDELANVPKEKKTKQGYLKDGFVVDSSETDESEYETEDEDADIIGGDADDEEEDDEGDIIIEDVGSELSEEEYI